MIVDSLKAAAKKMMVDFEGVTSKINHMGERGTSREELLLTYLRQYFPSKYQLSRGAIIDVNGTQSKQQDLIVFDSFSSPVLMNMESTKMIPIESVYMTIEVKSSLNKSTFEECVNNIKSVRELPKFPITNFVSPTAGFVFAFTSDTTLETLMGNLIEFNKNIIPSKQISAVCVLDKGLIINVSKDGLQNINIVPTEQTTPAIINNPIEENLLLFYLLLMQYLNLVFVSPPNLLKYAEKEGMARFSYHIPREHIPSGAYMEFEGNKIEVDNVLELIDDSDRLRLISSGKATIEQIMDYYSHNFSKMTKLANSIVGPNNNLINFFGIDYEVTFLQNVFNIYTKIKEGTIVADLEYELYKGIEQEIHKQYRSSKSDIS